jgi:biopolymer transport protein ExbB/TolQ
MHYVHVHQHLGALVLIGLLAGIPALIALSALAMWIKYRIDNRER